MPLVPPAYGSSCRLFCNAIRILKLFLNVFRKHWPLPAVENRLVYIIDAAAYTSRLGPRLVTGLEIMAEIIHPELFSGMIPDGGAVQLDNLVED
jgi:hypothetical protein